MLFLRKKVFKNIIFLGSKENYDHSIFKLKNIYINKCIYSFIISFFSIVLIHAQKVTLSYKNKPINIILNDVSNQTGYDFLYNSDVLKFSKPVSIKEKNIELTLALDKIFNNQPIEYKISNRTIILKIKPTKTDISDKSYSIAVGTILDPGGSPLAGITVKYPNTEGSTSTVQSDAQGGFQVVTQLGAKLLFAANGFPTREIVFNGEKNLTVQMAYKGNILPDVKVALFAPPAKIDPTLSIDLKNRAYMNLSQILQGTIPGLSLQLSNASKKIVTKVYVRTRAQGGFSAYTTDQFLQLYPTDGQKILDALISGQNVPGYNMELFRAETQTSVTTTLVPQLRGTNTFSAGTNGMLVVIDGFPREDFPADYPMANVESVEVIKDPKELIKWGPKANGGIIMVKTKTPKSGHLTMNYNSNFYYSPAPKYNRNKMQLASSANILDYTKDLLDSGFIANNYSSNPVGLNPAMYLLYKKMNNMVSATAFDNSWDSLKQLNNDDQLNLLMQNAFNHNHTLSVFGGFDHYKFSAIGSYNSTKTNDLGNYSHKLGLILNNDFNLLNNRLKMQLYVNLTGTKANAGTSFDPNTNLQPYQMLLDKDGNYIYDYTALNPDINSFLMSKGYYNFGSNLLQDARLNKNKSNSFQTQSRLTINYNVFEGFQWSTSVLYNTNNSNNSNLSDVNSSKVRNLINSYGEYAENGINFYVPYGDVMSKSNSMEKQLNARSAISYTKSFGKHRLNASLGGGMYTYSLRRPAYNIMYGYNEKTNLGLPIYLPSKNPMDPINNYTSLLASGSSTSYPYQLLNPQQGDSTNNRNLNINASLGYSFDNKFFLSGNYTNVYNPNYGQEPTYSTLSTTSIAATFRLAQRSIENWFNKLDLTTNYAVTKMPNLPTSYNNYRYYSSDWNTYSIYVNGYTPSQQGGQKSEKLSEILTSQFWKGHVELNVAINKQKTSNMSNENSLGVVTHDSSSVLYYMSAGAIVNMRKNLLRFNVNYNKSPEGQSQVNGDLSYDIAKESYFRSNTISTLIMDVRLESISPMQGLGLMMSTNTVQAGGGFSLATNGSFNSMPPKNTNFEIHSKLAISKDKYSVDLRYYNHSSSGLSSNIPVVSDPSTGLNSQYTYSIIKNKGVEFYLQGELIKTQKFSYNVTLNGAYNVNIASEVPTTNFTASSNYMSAYRSGYNTSNIWSYRWAGLDNSGNPQIYDKNNNKISNPDSATLASSAVYSGVTRAPWTGGIIQELNWNNFFSRIALNFNFGYVMRRYIPSLSTNIDKSVLINDRWKKPGDETHTDIAAISKLGSQGTYRSFIIKNASNSIISADNIRLQEIMIGWRAPSNFMNFKLVKSLIVTLQIQNAAVWTKNKWHIDPATVSSSGEVGMSIPVTYSGSLNLSF